MPELAEVEFYRRKWDAGLGATIRRVHLNTGKRVFRGVDTNLMQKTLVGAAAMSSAAHGKQMLFRFSGPAALGIHLGMTGELRVEPAGYAPLKHDHLILFQSKRSLVFSDARQFGRVRFQPGQSDPEWWTALPPSVFSPGFTLKRLTAQLSRHRTLPAKAVLLDQETFPGIGNWMADEILWQMRLNPRKQAGTLSAPELRALWKTVRTVSRRAIDSVAGDLERDDFGDPPKGFLFHVRWRKGGNCPRDGAPLRHETIGGRTTAWCPKCQPAQRR